MAVRRIGIIGDVHAEDERLETALEFLQTQGVDMLLCAGDIVDGPGDAERCCQMLHAARIPCVLGNHDRWLLQGFGRQLDEATQCGELAQASWEFLRSLPRIRTVETVAGSLLLCHGLGDNDMAGVRPDDFGYALEANLDLQVLIHEGHWRFVVNGHTHHRMVRQFGTITVINAGTLYRRHRPCCGVVDFTKGQAHFFDLSDPDAVTIAETFTFQPVAAPTSPDHPPEFSEHAALRRKS